jgi:hypothetical protein
VSDERDERRLTNDIGLGERPAGERQHAECLEEPFRDAPHLNPLGLTGVDEAIVGAAIEAGLLEHAAIGAPRAHVLERRRRLIASITGNVDVHELPGIREWQRPHHCRVDDAEQRRRQADADGEREDRDQRKAPLRGQEAQRVAQILKHGFRHAASPHVISPVLVQRNAAETPDGPATRFISRHTLPLEILGPHVHVRQEFFADFARDDVAAHERAQPNQEVAEQRRHQPLMTDRTARVSRAQLSCSAVSCARPAFVSR